MWPVKAITSLSLVSEAHNNMQCLLEDRENSKVGLLTIFSLCCIDHSTQVTSLFMKATHCTTLAICSILPKVCVLDMMAHIVENERCDRPLVVAQEESFQQELEIG